MAIYKTGLLGPNIIKVNNSHRAILHFIQLLFFSVVLLTTFAGALHPYYAWLMRLCHLSQWAVFGADVVLCSVMGWITWKLYLLRRTAPIKAHSPMVRFLSHESPSANLIQITFAILVAFLLHWTGTDLFSAINSHIGETSHVDANKALHFSWWLIAFIPGFGVLCLLFEHIEVKGLHIQYIRVLGQSEQCASPCKVLILPVSKRTDGEDIPELISRGRRKEKTDNGYIFTHNDGGKTVNAGYLTGDLEADTAQYSDALWNWWQMLRAIKPHVNTLERIYLLGSENGSGLQLEDARSLIWFYLEKTKNHNVKIDITKDKLDFENLKDLTKVYWELITELTGSRKSILEDTWNNWFHKSTPKPDYLLRDILIDTTGAFKIVSIVAAQATLKERELEFQYVQTINKKEPVYFNTCFQKEPKNL